MALHAPTAPARATAAVSPRVAWFSRHVVAVVVASVAVFAVPSLIGWARTGVLATGDFLDITVYRAGGAALLGGTPLYTADLSVGDGSYPFTYTPFAAALFTPLALVPAWLCQAAVIPAHVALLWAVVRKCLLCLGNPPGAEVRRAAIALTSVVFLAEPVLWTMWLGQINLVLLALVLFDLGSEHRWRGIGVGIAAGIKLTPGLFIPYLVCTRRFREAGIAAGTFAATAAVGALLAPADSADYFLGGTFADNTRFGDTDGAANLSLNGMLARAFGLGPGQHATWLISALVLGAAALVVAAGAERSGRRLLGLTLCGLASSALSPFSWSHHWVWVAPLAVLVLLQAPRWLGAALGALIFAWPVHVLRGQAAVFPALGLHNVPDWHGSAAVLGNAYLIVFLAALVGTASAVWDD